jgi:hypothetical protein
LVVVGLGAIAAYFIWPGSADWTPNIATGAISIALAITVIDRIVQRERERRTRPRRERALDLITLEYKRFGFRAQWDWVTTHLGVDIGKVTFPTDSVARLEFWLAGVESIDFQRPIGPEGRSLFLDEGIEFVQRIQRIVETDRELLPTDLVLAIDNLDPIFTGASLSDLAAEVSARDAPGLDRWLVHLIVQNAHVLGGALRRSIGERTLEFGSEG